MPVVRKKSQQKDTVKTVPDDLRESFVRLVSAKNQREVAEKRLKAEGAIVYTRFLRDFAEQVWNLGAKPQNARYGTYGENGRLDHTAIFQVKNQFSIQWKEREGEEEMPLAELLTLDLQEDAGLDQKAAAALVEREVHIYTNYKLRDVTALAQGRYVEGEWVDSTDVEKSAARKFLAWTLGQHDGYWTAEELAVALVETEEAMVRNGFFARVRDYCKNAEQLFNVLRVLKPVYYCSNMKFAESDSPESRVARLKEAANELISSLQ